MPEEIEEDAASGGRANPPRRMGGLIIRRRQLVFAAVMLLLAAKGFAGVGEIAFVVLGNIYLYIFLARFAFPRRLNEQKTRLISPNNKLFRSYFLATVLIGFLLPLCYVGEGIFRGGLDDGARAAAPNLFLLCGQTLMEPIGFSDNFSTPIGVLGPVFFNARRLFSVLDWLRTEFSLAATQRPCGPMRVYAGRALASANTAMWFFNLFGLLLPLFLPRALQIYFSAHKTD